MSESLVGNRALNLGIRANFGDVGHAMAWSRDYESYQECYEVQVFSNSSNSYNAIMSTISWGMKQGFTVLSVDGKKIESVTPEPTANGMVKRFRFVKEWRGTLTGGDV